MMGKEEEEEKREKKLVSFFFANLPKGGIHSLFFALQFRRIAKQKKMNCSPIIFFFFWQQINKTN